MYNIQPLWKDHPLTRAHSVELVPTDLVWRYYGKDVSPNTGIKNGKPESMETLWENLLSEGLRDPFILRVGIKNRKMRLEAGNHRIQLFKKYGIPQVPLTIQLREECGPHVDDVMTDATHNFDVGDTLLIDTIVSEYMRPSAVLSIYKDYASLA
jgi:hypothetical protein